MEKLRLVTLCRTALRRLWLTLFSASCFCAVVSASLFAQDCADCRLGPYMVRADMAAQAEGDDPQSLIHRLPPVPENFNPWWNQQVHSMMQAGANATPISVESLIVGTLQHSSQVRVFKDLPLIRRTSIVEADAAFDWTAFINTQWNSINEPVGNTLTVGPGRTRFIDKDYDYSMGLRRRNQLGGDIEIAQDFGLQDTNSVFFVPPNQGTARLALSYTQPLLRGAGRVYNTSLIVLAEIDTQIAQDEFSRQLQAHLLEVIRAYWGLYLERGAFLQKQRLYERAREILAQLEPRVEIDAPLNQIARARAAVTARQADLLRSAAAIRNAQDRIRALVNNPMLVHMPNMELVPEDQPTRMHIPVSLRESLSTALRQRPEIGQALKQIQAASVRMDMSQKELLPILDVILEAYASGLRGSSNVGQSFVDQFGRGAPSYSVGLQFEVPLHNRAARARFQRRQLELRQVTNQLDTTAETLMLEVEVAVREVNTSYQEMRAKYRSMEAAAQEVEYMQERWERLAGDDRTGSLVLEDLLAAQERLTDAEFGFLSAEVTYNLSLMDLKRATGELLQYEQITVSEACVDCLPELMLDKWERIEAPPEPPAMESPLAPQGITPKAEPIPGPGAAGTPPAFHAPPAAPAGPELQVPAARGV